MRRCDGFLATDETCAFFLHHEIRGLPIQFSLRTRGDYTGIGRICPVDPGLYYGHLTHPPPPSVYDSIVKRLERGETVIIDATEFTVTQLMMLARSAHAHKATLKIANGPFRVEDAMAIRRAGRGHVEYSGPKAA